MSRHEHFEELCALAAAGQLSAEEERQLDEHLKECDVCRQTSDEFSTVLHGLPVTERHRVDHALLRQMDDSEFRRRFLDRAKTTGRRFSEQALQGRTRTSWTLLRFAPAYQMAAVAGLILLIAVGALRYRSMPRNNSEPELARSGLTPTLATHPQSSENETKDLIAKLKEFQVVNETSQQTISSLKFDNVRLLARLAALEKQFEVGEAARQSLGQALARANEVNTQLSSQTEQNRNVFTQTTAELERARMDRTLMAEDIAAQKAKVNDLSEQVRLQTASLDRDRELLVAGRDITDLMGARNLHLIDVHDADGSGRDRKSFGRVFYTEGKSLIFYAFDLDEKRLANAKYKFEAWGERLGQPSSVKSLGILYSDDKTQRRWVLRVDNPQEIAQIDSVFVTLEPHDRESETPRGKKILYAFLGGQPNHP